MENGKLNRSIAIMKQSLLDEGILDGEFTRVHRLQSRVKPNLVEEVFAWYFQDSTALLDKVEQEMNAVPTDFSKMENILTEVRGNAASIGAAEIRKEIDDTRILLRQGYLESAKVTFQNLRNEHDILKTRLQPYFKQLKRQSQLEHRPAK